jgi:hypothetical protein
MVVLIIIIMVRRSLRVLRVRVWHNQFFVQEEDAVPKLALEDGSRSLLILAQFGQHEHVDGFSCWSGNG